MPVFATPGPITAVIDIGVGDVRIAASERSDTVVDVRPSDPDKRGDVAAAENTRVELSGGRLVIRATKGLRNLAPRAGRESIDIEIALPTGSSVNADVAVAAVRSTGTLGECRLKTAAGDIDLEHSAAVDIRTAAGDITVGSVSGDAAVTTGTGTTRIAFIDGAASVKNSNGDIWIGDVTGDVIVRAANGRIAIDRAHANVAARTAHGDVRIDEVARGDVAVQTGYGKVDVGVREGVAAWLDLNTGFGQVESSLEAAERPRPDEPTVRVMARSGFGDITIHRAAVAPAVRERV